jgi:diguanylate cyclase (GGDEF)-like protein/PAS domain S-box-containing protein
MSDLTVRPQDLGIGRLFEEIRDAVIVAEASTGRIVLWNRAATHIFGYSPAEALELRVEALVPERLRARHRAGLSRYRETGHGRYVDSHRLLEIPAVRKGGEEISIEMSLSPIAPVRDPGEADERFVLAIVRDVTERKRAYDRLAESERRFAAVVSNARAYVYRCRNEPGYPNDFASDYALELTGYPPEDLMVGGPVRFGELIVEEDRKRVWEEVQAALRRRERFEFRYTIRRRDGEVRHVEEYGQGIYDEDGNVVALEGIVYDVTERERMVERLREAEARYRTLVEGIPAIVYIEEMSGRMTTLYDSPQIEDMLGYPQGKYLEDPDYWAKIIHPDDRERVLADELRAIDRGGPLSQEYRVVANDGRVVWVRDDAAVVRGEAGEPLYWQGFIFDITERKEAEQRLQEAEARYRTLVERVPAVIYMQEIEHNNAIAYISPRIEDIMGYSPQEYIDDPDLWIETTHPEDRERVLAEDRHTDETGEPFRVEFRKITRDGRVIWVRDEAVLVRTPDGKPLYWQGVFMDITERKKNEEALRRSEASLAEAQRMAHLGNWEWDVRTGEVWWSDEVYRIYGLEPERVVPSLESLIEVVHPDDRGLLREAIDAALYGGEPYDFEHRVVRPSGEVRWVHRRAEVVRDERGEPLKLVGTVHDITERKALEEQLQYQALHDALTGLPNRALFMDRLEHGLARARRREGGLAVLFMDLDNFKVINDSLGHEAGDQLLVAVSERVQALLRPEDTVARLGGDEFVILLEDLADADEAIRVAERIAEALRTPFALEGRQMFVTASVGIALWDDARKPPGDLLRNADLAMYWAKHAGKARHEVFEEAMNVRALERLEMENELRRALERREFVVHYQPVVALDTGEISGFEALVRWDRPEHGLLFPAEFVPLAEDTGLIVPIGQWVLREACRQAREWRGRYADHPPPSMFVNLSPRQFQDPNLAQTVARITRETGLDPRWLELEITGGTVMGGAPATATVLEGLTALGVRIAIDDFGTGHSSLSYLERFQVDSLKIDRSFVEKLGQDPGTTVLVRGMIELAHALGLRVVAEGVETAEQLRQVRELGCDLAQGNHLSSALPGEAAGALLETRILR